MARWLLILTLTFAAVPCLQAALPTENDALALADADSDTLPPADRLFTRYIWIETGAFEDLQAVALTMNYFGTGAVLVRPMPLGKDKLLVARIDLRAYRPREKDINDLIATWEEFQFDPKFNLLITRDTLKFVGADVKVPPVCKTVRKTDWVLVDCEPYVKDGQTFRKKYVQKEVIATVETPFKDSDAEVVRLTSEHIDPLLMSRLVAKTQSQAPVVSHRYFLTRGLTTIKDKGLFKTIYGGLYYELAGIKRGAKKGTDLDVLLESLGVGNVAAGVTAEKIFEELRSDQRVAVFRSGVTGKPRRVDVLKTLVSRDGQSIVSITHDLKDDDIDIGTDPIMNLLKFKDAGREIIFEKANGLHGFAATDGDGKLVDEVPFNIAHDSTIPAPHTQRLQGAIGCIRCHGKFGGWQPLTNDVKKLLAGYLDVFGDNADRKKTIPDVLDRLAGLYSGDLERRMMPRARDDYATAILKATGPWKQSKDQTDVAVLASERIAKIHRQYVYDSIDAEKALVELGLEPAKGAEAVKVLKKLLPPVKIEIDGVIPEDPRAGALLTGLSINRTQFDLIYSFLATRIQRGHKP